MSLLNSLADALLVLRMTASPNEDEVTISVVAVVVMVVLIALLALVGFLWYT